MEDSEKQYFEKILEKLNVIVKLLGDIKKNGRDINAYIRY